MNKKLSFFPFVIANPLTRMKQSLFLSSRQRPGSSLLLSLRKIVSLAAIFLYCALPSSAIAEEKITVFPTTPVEAYTVYGSLALFWLAIIFLIIIIKMKLNEIERIQKLGIDKEDSNAPILD